MHGANSPKAKRDLITQLQKASAHAKTHLLGEAALNKVKQDSHHGNIKKRAKTTGSVK